MKKEEFFHADYSCSNVHDDVRAKMTKQLFIHGPVNVWLMCTVEWKHIHIHFSLVQMKKPLHVIEIHASALVEENPLAGADSVHTHMRTIINWLII